MPTEAKTKSPDFSLESGKGEQSALQVEIDGSAEDRRRLRVVRSLVRKYGLRAVFISLLAAGGFKLGKDAYDAGRFNKNVAELLQQMKTDQDKEQQLKTSINNVPHVPLMQCVELDTKDHAWLREGLQKINFPLSDETFLLNLKSSELRKVFGDNVPEVEKACVYRVLNLDPDEYTVKYNAVLLLEGDNKFEIIEQDGESWIIHPSKFVEELEDRTGLNITLERGPRVVGDELWFDAKLGKLGKGKLAIIRLLVRHGRHPTAVIDYVDDDIDRSPEHYFVFNQVDFHGWLHDEFNVAMDFWSDNTRKRHKLVDEADFSGAKTQGKAYMFKVAIDGELTANSERPLTELYALSNFSYYKHEPDITHDEDGTLYHMEAEFEDYIIVVKTNDASGHYHDYSFSLRETVDAPVINSSNMVISGDQLITLAQVSGEQTWRLVVVDATQEFSPETKGLRAQQIPLSVIDEAIEDAGFQVGLAGRVAYMSLSEDGRSIEVQIYGDKDRGEKVKLKLNNIFDTRGNLQHFGVSVQ